MTTKQIIATMLLSTVFFASCGEENTIVKQESEPVNRISFAMGISSGTSETLENKINTIDVYSFRRKNGESDYTLEKVYQDLIPEDDTINKNIHIELDGSLERMLYFVANCSQKIPFTPELSIRMFEDLMVIHTNSVPQAPYILVAKQSIPATLSNEPILVRLEHTLACLDIKNEYAGFNIDSLVIKNAVCGSVLFVPETPSVAQVPRANINYENTKQIYLYQTDASTLAVYGKYNEIRAVFDIPLNNIKKATRYRVTFRSINDSDVNFASNLSWNVTQWNNGTIVESTPDWSK